MQCLTVDSTIKNIPNGSYDFQQGDQRHQKTFFWASLEPHGPRDAPCVKERKVMFRKALTRVLYDQTAPQLCPFYVPEKTQKFLKFHLIARAQSAGPLRWSGSARPLWWSCRFVRETIRRWGCRAVILPSLRVFVERQSVSGSKGCPVRRYWEPSCSWQGTPASKVAHIWEPRGRILMAGTAFSTLEDFPHCVRHEVDCALRFGRPRALGDGTWEALGARMCLA